MSDPTTHIDEFESMFKRAEREPFVFADIPVNSIAMVIDGDRNQAELLRTSLIRFLPRLQSADNWRFFTGEDYRNVRELIELLDREQTDLVVTYRHLHEKTRIPQHSLGVYLDVLTQATTIPVLVLPGTAAEPRPLENLLCDRVMVVTDHISGDNRLINYGVRMCSPGGIIWFCHVEDESVFARYMHAIECIPEIETDEARGLLEAQLLKEAADFIDTCTGELATKDLDMSFHAVVEKGHHLQEYRKLIDKHDIDLLIANTKDDDQLAMQGVTYSVSVELLDVALLLL